MVQKARRYWEYAGPLRRRFGLIEGMRCARALSEAEYRAAPGSLVAVRVPGWATPVMLRAGTSDGVVFRQVLVGRELEFELTSPPRRILDGGMNFGLASLVFAARWPEADIVGVELEPGNLAAATGNCAHLPHHRAVHAALWDRAGTVTLRDPEADAHSFQAAESGNGISVRAVRIGELLDELGWDVVDLVKLDIEGAERRVLSDWAEWLPRTRNLLVELHDRFEPGCREAFDAAIADGRWRVREQGEYLLASRLDR